MKERTIFLVGKKTNKQTSKERCLEVGKIKTTLIQQTSKERRCKCSYHQATQTKQNKAKQNKTKQQTTKQQTNRYQQILELLLTGGYFRARINGLTPFDKILGGLAWAISASNVDIDIDVFQVCPSNIKHQTTIIHTIIKTGNSSVGPKTCDW